MPPVAAAEFDLDADRDVTTLVHADYDLHPLAVRSLDHYMEKGEEGERFHVR